MNFIQTMWKFFLIVCVACLSKEFNLQASRAVKCWKYWILINCPNIFIIWQIFKIPKKICQKSILRTGFCMFHDCNLLKHVPLDLPYHNPLITFWFSLASFWTFTKVSFATNVTRKPNQNICLFNKHFVCVKGCNHTGLPNLCVLNPNLMSGKLYYS